MSLFKKLKAWAMDGPSEPTINLLDIFIPKGPALSVSDEVMWPFFIEWKSQRLRHDN